MRVCSGWGTGGTNVSQVTIVRRGACRFVGVPRVCRCFFDERDSTEYARVDITAISIAVDRRDLDIANKMLPAVGPVGITVGHHEAERFSGGEFYR